MLLSPAKPVQFSIQVLLQFLVWRRHTTMPYLCIHMGNFNFAADSWPCLILQYRCQIQQGIEFCFQFQVIRVLINNREESSQKNFFSQQWRFEVGVICISVLFQLACLMVQVCPLQLKEVCSSEEMQCIYSIFVKTFLSCHLQHQKFSL